ncbi:hypothetical protein ACWJJH_14195 [Endozoicomonadaceae bacterium StTr2]
MTTGFCPCSPVIHFVRDFGILTAAFVKRKSYWSLAVTGSQLKTN